DDPRGRTPPVHRPPGRPHRGARPRADRRAGHARGAAGGLGPLRAHARDPDRGALTPGGLRGAAPPVDGPRPERAYRQPNSSSTAGPEATKPKTSRLVPASMRPFQPTFAAVTLAPLCDHSAFQALLIRCEPGQSQLTFQPSTAWSPALIVTLPCQPEPQSLTTSTRPTHAPPGLSSSPSPSPSPLPSTTKVVTLRPGSTAVKAPFDTSIAS